MTVFQELLSIKRYREQQAETALQSQRQLLETARKRHEEAVQQLQDFQRYAAERETALYRDLYREAVRISAIHYVLESVRAMREHEVALHETVQTREQEEHTAQALFVEAREHHRLAVRATEKFIELAQLHNEAALRESERHEDMEMEEVASMQRDQDEWSNHEEVEIA